MEPKVQQDCSVFTCSLFFIHSLLSVTNFILLASHFNCPESQLPFLNIHIVHIHIHPAGKIGFNDLRGLTEASEPGQSDPSFPQRLAL